MTDNLSPALTCARYRRVSGDKQTTKNQNAETEQMAAKMGTEIDPKYDYEDTGSAWSPRARLPQRDRLLRDARAGLLKGRVLILWALDRITRGGIADLMTIIGVLKDCGVRVVSIREPWLDTGGTFGDLLIAVVGWAAQYESDRKSERTRTAYRRVKAEGGRWGPKPKPYDVNIMRELKNAGWGYRRIARHLGVSVGTVHGRLKNAE